MIIIRGISMAYTKLFMRCTINHLVLSTVINWGFKAYYVFLQQKSPSEKVMLTKTC